MTTPSSQVGLIFTVAGSGTKGFSGDNGDAKQAAFNEPRGVAVDAAGNLYIADSYNHRVRKVDTNGIVTTVAGTGDSSGFSGDGGPATAAKLNGPRDVALDGEGNLYIADFGNHRVRKVTTGGTITTVAGDGYAGSTGDGGLAVKAGIEQPAAVAVDSQGNLYIGHHQYNGSYGLVRKVSPDGIITRFAGGGYDFDGKPTDLALGSLTGLAVDGHGNVFIAWRDGVHKITPDGTAVRFANAPRDGVPADGIPAVRASLGWANAVAVDGSGNVFIADGDRIRMVTPDGIVHTVAGNGIRARGAEGGFAYETELFEPVGLAVDAAGNLYISEKGNHRVRRETEAAGVITGRTIPPAPPAPADLYGEVVSPHTVRRGQQFDLGVRVKNRGPNAVAGENVTVVLTLPDGLVPVYQTGQRLTRSFPGALLPVNDVSFDGVFRVIAPEGTPPGEYVSHLEIQYAAELNIKDDTFSLPVIVVAPDPVQDETALDIRQETPAAVAPGQKTKFNIVYSALTGTPVNPGVITQTFHAPSGFVFDGEPSFAYYATVKGVVPGNLPDYEISEDKRTLVIKASPHVNTADTDTSPLVYTIPLLALPDAAPGTYTDGTATIGKHAPIQITGTISGGSHDETALLVKQEGGPMEAAPGAETTFNVEIRSRGNQPVDPGPVVQQFTAPTGFTFTGAATYGYYYAKPPNPQNLDTQLDDDNKTLTITFPPHVNTGPEDPTALLYTFRVRALSNATPGSYDDGKAVIGRLAPVQLTGHVL